MADRNPTVTVDKNDERLFCQMAWINKRPATSITAQVRPWIENAFDFDPSDPRTIDMSPRGMMAKTMRAMPTGRFSAVSIIVRTTNWRRVRRGSTVESVAAAYLEFAASSPALYEVMFSLSLSVPFDDAATPPEMRFAFSQLVELFVGQSEKAGVLSELFWASLHGIAELTRTKRFPSSRQKERVRKLVELFTSSR